MCRRLLELPQPEADQLGRVEWAATPMDVTKAYRKLSLLVCGRLSCPL